MDLFNRIFGSSRQIEERAKSNKKRRGEDEPLLMSFDRCTESQEPVESNKKPDIPSSENQVDEPLLTSFDRALKICTESQEPVESNKKPDIPSSENRVDESILMCDDRPLKTILNAIKLHMDNPKTLKNLLERLTDLLINHQYDNNLLDQARKIVLKVITKHLEIIKVEIAAIAALFYIVNNESQSLLLEDVIKKRIVTRIISLILYHDYDARILTWAFLTLDRLMLRWGFEKNHQYVMYLFQYFLRISLCIISADNQDYTLKIACVLINWCALGGTRIHRIYLGKSGTIKKLIVIIKTRIRQNTFEQVELAFETINHLTNDLPRNCKRFLDQKGLQYMFECLRTFPNKILMKQNIYCVLRNIAEIKELRGKLMKNHLIEVLFDNLRLTGDEIQIRYYAAEIIVHLASDGHKAWTIQSPTRCEVLDHMTRALQSWNLDVILDIRYRSVKTLLKIAQISHTPVCVQWAAWTLANLTRVYPEKYCSTVITEDGINIMSQVLKENYQISQQEVIHNLAQTVINQCMSFEENITE